MRPKRDFYAQGEAGIGPLFLLFLVFLTLKLTNVVDWSWWWVTCPLWAPVAAFFGFLVFFLLVTKPRSCSQSKEDSPRLWEEIAPYTWRMKVPTGWLVQINGHACVFVPDQGHVWEPK